MNEQKKLTPELEKRVQQAVENFMLLPVCSGSLCRPVWS